MLVLGERLWQQRNRRRNQDRDRCAGPEDRLPRTDQQNAGRQCRRERRHENEDRHDQRHLLGHLFALVRVANHRHRCHPWPGRSEAPDEAGDEQDPERRSDDREHRPEHVQSESAPHHGSPTEPVGEQPCRQKTERRSDEEERDDAGDRRCVVGQIEGGPDLPERRQRRVDGQRGDGHTCSQREDEASRARNETRTFLVRSGGHDAGHGDTLRKDGAGTSGRNAPTAGHGRQTSARQTAA